MENGLIVKNPCAIRGAGRERSSERPMFSVAQMQAVTDAVGERWRAAILLGA